MSMRASGIGRLLLTASLGLLVGRAQAQYPDRISTTINTLPATQFVTDQNNYLSLAMRVPGIVRTINPGSANTAPTFVGYSNYRGGRVFIRTVNGDPFTSADDNAALTPAAPYSTYSTIQCRFARTGGTTAAIQDAVWEVEDLYSRTSDPLEDPFVSYPANGPTGLSFAWRLREDHTPLATAATTGGGFTAGAGVYRNDTTGTNGGLAGEDSQPVVEVRQSYRLIRDKVRIEIEIVNIALADVVVAVNTFVNGQFGGAANDGQRFYVDTVRDGLATEFRFPSTVASDDPGLREIPDTWRMFDDELNPGVVVGGVWDGADIRSDALSAGPPNAAMLVNASRAGTAAYSYNPVQANLINQDWGSIARWTNVTVSPGQTKRFITYFGLAGADSAIGSPYTLSVEAPFSLSLATGDNPGTATVESADNVYRQPNPFQVVAYLNNITSRTLSNLAVSLALPDGFTLAGPTDTATKTVATLPPGTEQQVSWTVRSADNQSPGTRVITVSSSGNGLNSKVIDREIGIPALPQLAFPSLTKRLDMISVPYDFDNQDLEHILGSLGSLGVTGGGAAAVARFNPETRSYAFFPDPYITTVRPGEGFWLFNGSLATLNLPTDRAAIPATQAVTVALSPDWNQLGCPYTVPVRLFDCEVVTNDNVVRDFEDAVNAGVVRPVVYEYSPNPTDPNAAGRYDFSGDGDTMLNPWRGYWLRVTQQVSLVFRASNLIGPFRGAGRNYLQLAQGWEIGLQGSLGQHTAQVVSLGQDAGSRDGYDARDVDLPPAARGLLPLQLAVVHPDWGRDAGAYLRDIRSAGGQTQRWQVEARSEQPNQDVTLRWNLRSAPAEVQFTLVDLQSGTRRHLRTTSSYVYNSGPYGGTRQFQVIAERRSGGSLAVPQMAATAGRGRSVTVNFALTAAATVEVVIESPTGRRVRTVATGFAGQAGQNQVGWDGRDDAGRPVPAGPYRCRVLVHTADGQRAVAERIVVVNR
ncbi:MAG: hypothetical protein IT204_04710 [Fimbriimonadaceae bacterium]|nr:hypothetical protein [Fimbriimonadaceae bacterium]